MINRMFNTDDRAIVSQATEYDILGYVANDDDMRDLLDRCFMDPEFTTVQYLYVMPPRPNHDDDNEPDGYYVVDYHGGNPHEHLIHDFGGDVAVPDPALLHAGVEAIPPPPPINNFQEIYHYYYNHEYNNNDNNDDSDSDSDSDSDDYEVRG
jgi:hypothetical protein